MMTILSLMLFALGAWAGVVPRQASSCASLPSGYTPPQTSKLPDPFTFANGTSVTTLSAWACRQEEISQLLQTYELGTKPPAPSSFSASLSSNTLTMTAQENGKSISFSATISYPSSGTAPYPAIIAYGAASLPIPAGVATITFNNDDLAAQAGTSSRGQGKFYTLYGASHPAGALTAWAWGVSRILDALAATPSARIDAARVGVTGCSRNGKGAFVAGALDPRIALTLPQESGAGGAACWRISDQQKAAGQNVQTAAQIVTENVWFARAFEQFGARVASLPEDHHLLAALVAPRGLLVLENDIDWLGPVSTTGCMKVGRLVYGAAGAPDAMGFSLVGGHNHCQFPAAQQPELSAFIDKYLLRGSSSTAGVEKSTRSVDVGEWMDWTVPVLE